MSEALLQRGVEALERIAQALEAAIAQPEASPAEIACSHPDTQRVEMGGMGEPDNFFCKACKQTVRQETAHV